MLSINVKVDIGYLPRSYRRKSNQSAPIKQGNIASQFARKTDIDFVIDVLTEYGFEQVDFVYEPDNFRCEVV